MDRKGKEAVRAVAESRFEKANAAVIAEFRGLTVASLTELRKALKKVNAEFRIVKNRIAKKAVLGKAESGKELADSLKGPVGIAFLYGDAAAGAKALADFEKGNELFKITAGVMDAKKLSAKDVKAIAALPSREVLLGQIVGLMVSPHRGLLGVITAVPRSLVQVINQIKEKK
ncbi:MAG: 50S ribosomal protein L10 [Pseudomonadota bacterium]